MTREHKLGLILGFSVLLAIAVLISDHFSAAQRDDVVADAAPQQASSQTTPISAAPVPVAPARRLAEPPAATTRVVAQAPERPLEDPIVIDQRASRRSEGSLTRALRDDPPRRAEASPQMAGGASSASDLVKGLRERAESKWREWDLSRGAAAQPARAEGPRDARSTAPSTSPTKTSTPSQELPSPQRAPDTRSSDRLYPVQPNESLYAICEDEYGDGTLWRQLAAYNSDRVGKNGSVRSGVTLRLPSLDRLKPGATRSTVAAASTSAREETKPNRPEPSPSGDGRTYVVQPGDTLGSISMDQLGTSSRWREIAELNKKTLPNPDRVVVGIKLRLPAK